MPPRPSSLLIPAPIYHTFIWSPSLLSSFRIYSLQPPLVSVSVSLYYSTPRFFGPRAPTYLTHVLAFPRSFRSPRTYTYITYIPQEAHLFFFSFSRGRCSPLARPCALPCLPWHATFVLGGSDPLSSSRFSVCRRRFVPLSISSLLSPPPSPYPLSSHLSSRPLSSPPTPPLPPPSPLPTPPTHSHPLISTSVVSGGRSPNGS